MLRSHLHTSSISPHYSSPLLTLLMAHWWLALVFTQEMPTASLTKAINQEDASKKQISPPKFSWFFPNLQSSEVQFVEYWLPLTNLRDCWEHYITCDFYQSPQRRDHPSPPCIVKSKTQSLNIFQKLPSWQSVMPDLKASSVLLRSSKFFHPTLPQSHLMCNLHPHR